MKSCDEKQREPIPVHVPNQPSNSNKFIPEVALALYGLILNLLWEFGHSVLYLDHARDRRVVDDDAVFGVRIVAG